MSITVSAWATASTPAQLASALRVMADLVEHGERSYEHFESQFIVVDGDIPAEQLPQGENEPA